jgi:hypothetical protein
MTDFLSFGESSNQSNREFPFYFAAEIVKNISCHIFSNIKLSKA